MNGTLILMVRQRNFGIHLDNLTGFINKTGISKRKKMCKKRIILEIEFQDLKRKCEKGCKHKFCDCNIEEDCEKCGGCGIVEEDKKS